MIKDKLLKIINAHLKRHQINGKQLDIIILDISRILDTRTNHLLNRKIKQQDVNLNAYQKNQARDKLLGYPIQSKELKLNIKDLNYTKKDLIVSYRYVQRGYKRRPKAMIQNIISRYRLHFLHQNTDIVSKYVSYLHRLQKNKYQLLYLRVTPNTNLDSNDINHFIKKDYDKLSNYHNCVINFINPNGNLNWNMIAKVAIFMSNFRLERHFHVFNSSNRKSRIQVLSQFLKQNSYINEKNLNSLIKKFYLGVAYGFRFIDLFISNDCHKAMLVMQKVQLDETPKRCPVCFAENTRGNSYPHVLFKSFECQNPNCPARSKSGRGKRYNLLSAKRQIMVKRNNKNDYISNQLIKALHLDITNPRVLNLNSALKLYTWSGDEALVINQTLKRKSYQGRKLVLTQIKHHNYATQLFNQLGIVKLLNKIANRITFKNQQATDRYNRMNQPITYIVNDNSNQLRHYQNKLGINITSAITSPPYYNARSYSQWDNFLCYLIDMLVNAKAVYNTLANHSIYIYNVGDIVDQDKVYIKSRMSISRLMLGFYSALILTIAGFHLESDFIWDKGQVQSKRNSTNNHFPGYIKPDNAYEHDLVMCKGKYLGNKKLLKNKVLHIAPVKKINSKGKNTVGHSAPFPMQIAQLILPFSKKNDYVLDPFLGSGTTCKMAKMHGYQSIGIELSPKYYQLSIQVNQYKNHYFKRLRK